MRRHLGVRLGAAVAVVLMLVVFGCGRNSTSGRGGASRAQELRQFSELMLDPVRVVQQDDDGVVFEVTAEGLSTRDVTVGTYPAVEVRVPGFSSGTAIGSPEMPRRVVYFGVPVGRQVALEVLDRAPTETHWLNAPVSFGAESHGDIPVSAIQPNARAYAAISGESLAEVLEVSYAGFDRVAEVRLTPVRHDPAQRQLIVTPRYTVRLRFVATKGLGIEMGPTRSPSASFVTGMLTNGDSYGRHVMLKSVNAAPVDLVIADASYRDALQRYLQFKRSLGREVREVYVTRPSRDDVKAKIAQEYRSPTPPSTVMLVGSIDQIPNWSMSVGTDYGYMTLDQGSLPDVAVGRVPAQSTDELAAFIEKAIARETGKREPDAVLLTAGNDTGMGCPSNVARVGELLKSAAGGRATLTKKFRSEGASTRSVFDAYNANPNIVFYDGHGNTQGMKEIPLTISKLSELTNTVPPLVFDIACENAEWQGGARNRHFAEMNLFHRGAGVAGIMAAGGMAGGHEFFQDIGKILGESRKAMLDGGDRKLNQVGQVILAAKVKADRGDREMFSYYGDPASSVWESDAASPQPPSNAAPLFVGLGAGDAAASLAVAAPSGSPSVAVCVGTMADCGRLGAVWLPLARARDLASGMSVYMGMSTIQLIHGMSLTVYARGPNGVDLWNTVLLRRR